MPARFSTLDHDAPSGATSLILNRPQPTPNDNTNDSATDFYSQRVQFTDVSSHRAEIGSWLDEASPEPSRAVATLLVSRVAHPSFLFY